MKKDKKASLVRMLFVAACTCWVIILVSCGGTKPSRFYLLTTTASAREAAASGDIAVGVGPIKFPDYLMRPQIALHAGPNELSYAEYDRWAEPLSDNFARVLVENLSTLMATERITTFPWSGAAAVQYQVTLEVIRFQAEGQDVSLIARWSVYLADELSLLETGKSSFSASLQPSKKPDYKAIAAAMSQLVGELSEEIASAISAHSNRQSGN